MQSRNRLLDDLARVASGAAGTVAGIRGEVESVIRQRLEAVLDELNVVTREEFEATKTMASKARTEQEKLEKRVAELEAQLNAGKKPTASKSAPKKKPSTSKSSSKRTTAKRKSPAKK